VGCPTWGGREDFQIPLPNPESTVSS